MPEIRIDWLVLLGGKTRFQNPMIHLLLAEVIFMTVHELSQKLGDLIRTEREITNEILGLINIGFEKRAYLDLGFSSMFDWLTRGFGYSNGSAQRRIEAARFMKSVPVVAEKLEKGEVSLSMIAQVQSVIKKHEANQGSKISFDQKLNVLNQVEKKTILETEQILVSLFPDVKSSVSQERHFVIDQNTIRHSMNFSSDVAADLKRAKEVLSHIFPQGSDAEVIGYALKLLLDKVDPLRKKVAAEKLETKSSGGNPLVAVQAESLADNSALTTAAEVIDRNILTIQHSQSNILSEAGDRSQSKPLSKVAIKRLTVQASNGACTFKDPLTGQTCNSRYQVQIDHIKPKALGGGDHPANLRTLCRQHNLLMAERTFGKPRMESYRKDKFVMD